mmetsp:Transcript_30534/g.97590  ORF Transcript_30534/g.97590 Transcript_30534/m.97590 type:complete len:300 (-) Transcript_30534:674-1573(-)
MLVLDQVLLHQFPPREGSHGVPIELLPAPCEACGWSLTLSRGISVGSAVDGQARNIVTDQPAKEPRLRLQITWSFVVLVEVQCPPLRIVLVLEPQGHGAVVVFVLLHATTAALAYVVAACGLCEDNPAVVAGLVYGRLAQGWVVFDDFSTSLAERWREPLLDHVHGVDFRIQVVFVRVCPEVLDAHLVALRKRLLRLLLVQIVDETRDGVKRRRNSVDMVAVYSLALPFLHGSVDLVNSGEHARLQFLLALGDQLHPVVSQAIEGHLELAEHLDERDVVVLAAFKLIPCASDDRVVEPG